MVQKMPGRLVPLVECRKSVLSTFWTYFQISDNFFWIPINTFWGGLAPVLY